MPNGICLQITSKGDRYQNTVISITMVDGEPKLTVMENTVKHYGLKESRENIDLTEW